MITKLLIAEENARYEMIKAECDRLRNSPDRVARRGRIADHVGRPLNIDTTKLDPHWEQYAETGTWTGDMRGTK